MKALLPIFLVCMSFIAFANFGEPCCSKEKKPGRCTGSAYCTACRNCSRCAYCNSGGTCGVCSPPTTRKKTKRVNYNGNSGYEKQNYQQYSLEPGGTESEFYMVNTSTLNLRKNPSTNSEILCKLKLGDLVTFVKRQNSNWIEVIATCEDGSTVTGFVYSTYVVSLDMKMSD